MSGTQSKVRAATVRQDLSRSLIDRGSGELERYFPIPAAGRRRRQIGIRRRRLLVTAAVVLHRCAARSGWTARRGTAARPRTAFTARFQELDIVQDDLD